MRENIFNHITSAAISFVSRMAILLLLFIILRLFELASDSILHGVASNLPVILFAGVVKDVSFILSMGFWLFVIYVAVYLLHKKAAHVVFIILTVLLCVAHISLVKYFLATLSPLGGDLWSYSLKDIKQTVGASGGISFSMVTILILLIAMIIAAFIYLPRKIYTGKRLAIAFILFFTVVIPFKIAALADKWHPSDKEYNNSLSTNKSYFFYTASKNHFFPKAYELDIYSDSYSGDFEGAPPSPEVAFIYPDETNYPFLHKDETPDVLSPFLNKSATRPNIVIIMVEGLGRAFTNNGAYLGNFTPFIDSLSRYSLYWTNFLSTGGRTFAVLPSLLGSLPFAKNGFCELGENMPKHLSLVSLLKYNGYLTTFYYGGDAHFDNMDIFLKHNSIDKINDIKTFPASGYIKQPAINGFTWGYGDKELFRRYLEIGPGNAQPYLSILLTVSTHSPFLISEQQTYLDKFEQRMNELSFNDTRKNEARSFKMQYASILYADDAIRGFINKYSLRADFGNTVFIITGDHRMPEIPMSDKLDRYLVPLIIYSPLLKRTAAFSSISTHFDITPTLLAYLKNVYHIKTPSLVSWIGSGIDTARSFRNVHSYPLMQTKSEFIDFIKEENMLNETGVYKINNEGALSPITDKTIEAQLTGGFEKFKQRNNRIMAGAKIIPDSIYQRYFPR